MNRELEVYYQSVLPAGEMRAKIYSVSGRLVRQLAVAGQVPDYSVRWDGRDESGQPAPTGIYILVLKAGDRMYRAAVVLAR